MFIDPCASLMVLMIHYKMCVNRASVMKDVCFVNIFADNVKKILLFYLHVCFLE